jgi:hypothetical protein
MKSKFDKRVAAILLIIIVVVAAIVVWQVLPVLQKTPSSNNNLPDLTLTVVGFDGQQVVLHSADLAALTSFTGKGGTKSSAGDINSIGEYTGVPVLEICDLVGGINPDNTLTVSASDGYSMVYTYYQVHGKDFTTFDPVTGNEKQASKPLTLAVCYFANGSVLPPDVGPLRMGILGEEGLLGEGHFWTYWVTKIEITSSVRDWNVLVDVTGIEPLTMDRQSFTSILYNSPLDWTDSSGNVWTGTALWRWALWTNYHGGVSNASLDAGYTLKVISGSGNSVIFDDSRVKMNDNIIVAAELNGAPLSDPYWPLTLVGSGISSEETIKNIVQLQITLDNPSSFPSPGLTTTPSPSISPSPTPTPSPTPLSSMTLTVVGSTGTQVILHSIDIAALTAYSAYGGTRSTTGTLANFGNYTGVPMLTLCNLVGGVTSSQTVRVTASDDYAITYSYAQVNGQEITTYNSAGNPVTPTQPLTMIVAYYQDGASLPSGVGPLRIMIVGPEGLYASGSLSARLVVKIEVLS